MIHPTAIIDPKAYIGLRTIIGAYSIIGPDVVIEDDCHIHSNVCIGDSPEIRGYERSNNVWPVIIKRHTEIREFTSIHCGSIRSTRIDQGCYIMGHCNIAHDCELAANVTLSHGVVLAGHVTIMKGATLGMAVVVHQRTTIGQYSMIAANATVVKDIVPLAKYIPNKPLTVNVYAINKYKLFSDDLYHPMPAFPTWNDICWRSEYENLEQYFSIIRNKSRDVYHEGLW